MYRPDQDIIHKIDQWITKNRGAFIHDLDRLVSIPSISVQGEDMYPFGKACARVLDEMTDIAAGYGFHIENHEYYCGSCRVKGTSEHAREVGFYAHLDVVPLGEGWQYPPLRCTEKDGYLIGRGVGDNKGPGICVLYALRFLKEHKITLKNDVMIYYGLSEETGMQDLEYFCRTQTVPDVNLVTDTNFPVCYGEKGIMRAELDTVYEGNLVSFTAGSVINVIPAKAEAVISGVSIKEAECLLAHREGISISPEGDNIKISAAGISKHAAFPEDSVNAIHVLAEALLESNILCGSVADTIKLVTLLTNDSYGAGAGIPMEDQESGKLTCVGSLLNAENGKLKFSFDIRYPVTASGELVIRLFRERTSEFGFALTILEHSAPAFVPLDNPYIPLLCEICDYVQGTHYEPYTMGGGTYSRHLPSAVGFGPGIPDAANPFESGHGQGHQPDECVSFDMLLKGLRTYIISLIEIDQIL